MSRLRLDLEHVSGAGIAELRGFATYNVTQQSKVRTTITEPIIIEAIEIPAEDGPTWSLWGLNVLDPDGRKVHLVARNNLVYTGTYNGMDRISLRGAGGLASWVRVNEGWGIELLVENNGYFHNADRRIFRSVLVVVQSLREPTPGLVVRVPLDSAEPIGRTGHLAGPRWLLHLGNVVHRFAGGAPGHYDGYRETTMPDVRGQHVYPDHVEDFVAHYEHIPGAPIRCVSLHTWVATSRPEMHGRPSYSTLQSGRPCPVLYGIDEQSDRLVLEIGCTDPNRPETEPSSFNFDPPFFHARFDLNGLDKPWWWEDACRATATSR